MLHFLLREYQLHVKNIVPTSKEEFSREFPPNNLKIVRKFEI